MHSRSNICAYCGHTNQHGLLFCEECANPLTSPTDETIRRKDIVHRIRESIDKLDTGERTRFEREAQLLLHIRNEPEPLAVSVGAHQLTIGRFGSKSNGKIDIDLTSYGALNKGVSRLHAVLFRDGRDRLCVQDMDSANGTYLNGQRLAPHQAFPVNDGDEISFGSLRTHAYFDYPTITANHS